MESDCEHAWTSDSESLGITPCIDPDDEDKWEFEAVVTLKDMPPYHFSFRDANAPDSNGEQVCAAQAQAFGVRPAEPRKIPASCEIDASARVTRGTLSTPETLGSQRKRAVLR